MSGYQVDTSLRRFVNDAVAVVVDAIAGLVLAGVDVGVRVVAIITVAIAIAIEIPDRFCHRNRGDLITALLGSGGVCQGIRIVTILIVVCLAVDRRA